MLPAGFDDLEEEDYDLIAENTGIQLQRKKFRRVHGNVLDSDEEEEEVGGGKVERSASSGPKPGGTSVTLDDSMDSSHQDEDFAHVSEALTLSSCVLFSLLPFPLFPSPLSSLPPPSSFLPHLPSPFSSLPLPPSPLPSLSPFPPHSLFPFPSFPPPSPSFLSSLLPTPLP